MTLRGNFGDPRTERDVRSAKRFNFIALIVLMVVLLVGFLLTMQLLQKQRQLEEKTQQLADSTANLKRIRSELEAAQHAMERRDSVVHQQLHDLSSSVAKRDFGDAMIQAKNINKIMDDVATKSYTLVHLYAWHPREGTMERIRANLQEPDYTLVNQEILTDLPSWMGTQSAVYYYDPKVEDKAKTLTHVMHNLTGTEFETRRGSAGDAPSYDKHDWLTVQYLGDDPQPMK